jgi:hypothetical protein
MDQSDPQKQQQCKGLKQGRRRRAQYLRCNPAEPQSRSAAGAARGRLLDRPDKPSIAVLPFQNMSGASPFPRGSLW